MLPLMRYLSRGITAADALSRRAKVTSCSSREHPPSLTCCANEAFVGCSIQIYSDYLVIDENWLPFGDLGEEGGSCRGRRNRRERGRMDTRKLGYSLLVVMTRRVPSCDVEDAGLSVGPGWFFLAGAKKEASMHVDIG
jgi:hypothetical protein